MAKSRDEKHLEDTIEAMHLVWDRFREYGVVVCLYDKKTRKGCSVGNLANIEDIIRFLRNEADRIESKAWEKKGH